MFERHYVFELSLQTHLFILSTTMIPSQLFLNAVAAITQSDLKSLKDLIAKEPGLVNFRHNRVPSLLHHAAARGNEDIVNYLIEQGANVEKVDSHGQTPIFVAVANFFFYKSLFGKSNVNHQRHDGLTALMVCIAMEKKDTQQSKKAKELIKFFLASKKIDYECTTATGNNLAHVAIMSRALRAFATIIKCNSLLLEKKNNEGNAPLDLINYANLIESGVEWFSKKKIAEDIINARTNQTSQSLAKDLIALQLWILRGGDVNQQDEDGRTLCHFAAECGAWQSVLLLLKRGADVTKRTVQGDLPIHYAFRGKEDADIRRTVYHLCKYKSPLNEQNSNGDTPMLMALCTIENLMDRDSIVKELLANGADVTLKFDGHMMPIDALNFKNPHEDSLLELFLEKGADVNSIKFDGHDAATRAAMEGHIGALEVLMEYGYDVNKKVNVNGLGKQCTILQAAVFSRRKQLDCIEWLISEGKADPDIANEHGQTARQIGQNNKISFQDKSKKQKKRKADRQEVESVQEDESGNDNVEGEAAQQMKRVKEQINFVLDFAKNQCGSEEKNIKVDIKFCGNFTQSQRKTITVSQDKDCEQGDVDRTLKGWFDFQSKTGGKKAKVEMQFAFDDFDYKTTVE